MPFLPMPSELQVQILPSDLTEVGSYKFDAITELKALRLFFYHHNLGAPTAQVRLVVSLNSDGSDPLASTVWLTMSEIVNTAAYWFGWVTFNFSETASVPASDTPVYIFLESSGYTMGADSFLAAVMDDVPEVNDKAAAENFGAAIQFIKFEA